MKQAIRQRRSKVNRKINDYAKELEKKILANHEKLKTTFDEHLSQKRFQLKDTISSIESLLEKASSNIDKLDCISDELSISKTFIKEDAIINKLEDIESETYKIIEAINKKNLPEQNECLKICPHDNFVSKIQTAPTITTEPNNRQIVYLGNSNCILVYNIDNDEWEFTKLKTDPHFKFKTYSSAVSMEDGRIFLIGGGLTNEILEFDPKTLKFTKKNSMDTPRSEHACVVANDKIYILGGYNKIDNCFVKECEIYDTRRDIFLEMSDMNTAKCDFAAAHVKE